MRYPRFTLLSAALPAALSGLGSSPLGAQTNKPPEFARSPYSFELPENLTRHAVGTVVATDPEGGPITYRLTGGWNRFSIDAGGVVQYGGPGEDYEGGRKNFELSVRATDSDGLYATARVEVAVQDVNEVPTFERDLYAFSLAENRAGPVAVGRVRARDQDAGSRLRYSLAGEAAGGFDVDDRGRVSYVGAGEDFEGGSPELSMTVTATDGGGLSGSASITVALRDVNEAPTASAIPPIVLEVGASRDVHISGHFVDPDGDELSYQAIVLGAASVVSAEMFGDLLTLVAGSVGRAEVQVMAFDPGGLSATGTLSVTVTISAADRERTLRRTLSAFGRTIGTAAADAIAQRLDLVDDWDGDADIAGGSHLRLGDRSLDCAMGGCSTTEVLAQAADLIGFGEMWRTAERLALTSQRGASTYQEGSGRGRGGQALPSSPGDRLTLSALASGGSAQVAHGGLTLWARVGSGGFEGTPDDDFTVDGSSLTAFVGGDYQRRGGVAFGLAGSRSSASIDFESGVNGEGTVEARITGVHPYLRWSPRDIDAWATAGLGWGDADLDDQGGVLATDLRLTMGAGGVSKRISKFLSIRADAFQTTISTSDAEGIDALDAVSRRVRIAPQLSGRIDGGSTALSANVEVGMRVDGGDAETGVGAGVAGDLAMAYAPLGVTLGARGRTVVAHQDSDLRDWGVGVELSVRPGRRSSGLSISVVPAWGEVASDIRRLWREAAAKPASAKAIGHRLHPDQVRVEMGYALRTGVVHLVGERAFDPDGTPLTRLVLEGRVGL